MENEIWIDELEIRFLWNHIHIMEKDNNFLKNSALL